MSESHEDFDPLKCLPQNEEQWAATVSTYQPLLFRYAFAIVGDQQHAEDLVQKQFIKIVRGQIAPDERGLKGLLINAVVNDSKTLYGRLKRTERPSDAIDAGSFAPDLLLTQELRKAIDDCIDRLSEKQRLIIQERLIEERTIKEIAESLNSPQTSVDYHYLKALPKLQQCLSSKGISLGSAEGSRRHV